MTEAKPWFVPAMFVASVALLVTACAGGPSTEEPTAQTEMIILTPNDVGEVTVLFQEDLVEGGSASQSWIIGEGFQPNGLTLGPDGRLYVSQYGSGASDRIFIVDPDDFAATGVITPVAGIVSDLLDGPIQGSFDSQGRFWVANYLGENVLRFDGLLDVEASSELITLDPDLVLTVDTSGGATSFTSPYDVFVDGDDSVWVADSDEEAIYRFSAADVGSLSGEESAAPALFLTYGDADQPSGSTYNLNYPFSLFVTDDGTLYVANLDYEVSRFDDAATMTGVRTDPADAYLQTGFAYPNMVHVDGDGALWIAHGGGELVKVSNPGVPTGVVDVTSTAELVLSWSVDGGALDPAADGGRQAFLTIPKRP